LAFVPSVTCISVSFCSAVFICCSSQCLHHQFKTLFCPQCLHRQYRFISAHIDDAASFVHRCPQPMHSQFHSSLPCVFAWIFLFVAALEFTLPVLFVPNDFQWPWFLPPVLFVATLGICTASVNHCCPQCLHCQFEFIAALSQGIALGIYTATSLCYFPQVFYAASFVPPVLCHQFYAASFIWCCP